MLIATVMLTACSNKITTTQSKEHTNEAASVIKSTEKYTEPETKNQENAIFNFTGLLERWPVGSANDEYDSYYWYYEGEENDYKLWDGTKHSVCEDDNKKIIGEELLQSVMEGKHSFKYMQNGTGMNAYNEFAITDGAMLNMDEFFYMLRYAYTGTKDNLQCDVHDFMVLDLDGDGVRELIMSGNSSAIGFNVVFYTSGNEAYMTAFNMVNGGSITADGLIEGGYCDTYRVKRDGDKMNLVVNSYYRYSGDNETIILDGPVSRFSTK